MMSIATGEDVEARHFMDGEHQITIGIDRNLWPRLQVVANEVARGKGWLRGSGTDWDCLNVWIIGRLNSCPKGMEPYAWVARAAQ